MDKGNINLIERLQEKIRELINKYSIPRWAVFGFDVFSVFITFLIAYLLRFNFMLDEFNHMHTFYHGLLTVTIYAVFSIVFSTYSGLIRHTTIIDIFNIIITTTFSSGILLCLSIIGRHVHWNIYFIVPISIILIHYVSITVLLVIVRIMIKLVYLVITKSFEKNKKVLIYGAGDMGVIVKRVIQSDVQSCYQIDCFLDNNKKLQGKKLTGFPVYSTKILSKSFLQKRKIKTLIFATRNISPKEKSEIINQALNWGLEILETPAVDKWLNGQLQMNQIKNVKLEDLLGRDPIQLNMENIGNGLNNRTILVTGAAGSIGSEIVRQLTRFEIKKLILVDQSETPMFNLEKELIEKYNTRQIEIILADVTSMDKMDLIFKEFNPEIVFHAAAYKHVPLMEKNPHEAIRVNILGTKIITELSVKYKVTKLVMISTDKAVNPANIMGASKRVCEIIVQLKSQQQGTKTQFVITRFGNVLGSNGSVVPIFSRQIEEGGPVTVTDPKITRYFMTIPEACQLVLEAGFMGKGGEIFVFDMGKQVKIIDLAKQMIRLSGLTPEEDIKIVFIGLRPGEKMHEELLTKNENTIPTHHPKIKIARVEKLDSKILLSRISRLIEDYYTLSKEELIEYLKNIVPEYQIIKDN